MYFLTVGPETPVAAAMPLTDSPLLALLLISSTLSTPIISFPDLPMSKSDRIDNCRSKAAVGAGLTISENFRLPEWKAAFTIFVNQTLPNTYMTVVVDHDRGRVVRACAGHGKRQLNAFLDLLTEGRRAGIEVTADGARRIADVVAERAPGAELAADPFHAVSRATGTLDELRRRSWREAGSRPAPKRRRGRPRKGEQAPPDPAGQGKGLRLLMCNKNRSE